MNRRHLKSIGHMAGIGFTAAAILGLAAMPSAAAERGKFRGTAVLMNTQFQQIKAPDGNPGGAVMMGEMEGLVFNDAKKSFLDKAHYNVVWKGDGRGAGDCFKTFSMANGDKLFASCAGKATGTGFEGTVELLGGTGAFSGIRGKGTYRLTNVSERVMWDVLEWDYELP
jgi:hypothetical protein